MDLLTINGVNVTDIKTYQVSSADLDSHNTSLSESGYLNRERIRADRHKIQLACILHANELEIFANAISPSAFTVKFLNPTRGAYTTATMYAGDRNSKLVSNDDLISETLWEISVNLIEY